MSDCFLIPSCLLPLEHGLREAGTMSVLFSVGSQHWAQRPAHSWPSVALVSRWMGLLRTWSEMKQEKDWVETNAVQGHMGSGSRILKAQNIPPCLGTRWWGGSICGRQRLWVQILPPPPTEYDWANYLAPLNHSLLKVDNNSLQLWGLHRGSGSWLPL